jgi:hypothetical protein
MRRSFHLSPNGKEHIQRHFLESNLAGSHFYTSVFAGPEALVEYILRNEPEAIVVQNEYVSAYCYGLPEKAVGVSGLARRSELGPHQIERRLRDGYSMEIALVDQLPETNQFVVIARNDAEGLSVITAFPGGYAPPFPHNGQPSEEYRLNEEFWKAHILLQRKECEK